MASKKIKYQYAKVVEGRVVTEDTPEIQNNEAFADIGLYITGKAREKEELVKVSRSLLKDSALNIGRGKKRDLKLTPSRTRTKRDTISRRATGIALYIQTKWGVDAHWERLHEGGYISIERGELSKVAKQNNTTPQRFKEYLTELGTFTYHYVKPLNKGKRGDTQVIAEEFKPFFDVKIIRTVGGEIKEGYITDEEAEFLDNKYSFDRILIRPCERYRGDIGFDAEHKEITDNANKRLQAEFGNVLAVADVYKLPIQLSDMATKLLLYTSSNKPKYDIGFERLKKHLKISDSDISKQGKPRILDTIKKGFDELIGIGHLEYCTYSKNKDIFYLKYTDKYIKHSEFVSKKVEPSNTEYIGKEALNSLEEIKKKLAESKRLPHKEGKVSKGWHDFAKD